MICVLLFLSGNIKWQQPRISRTSGVMPKVYGSHGSGDQLDAALKGQTLRRSLICVMEPGKTYPSFKYCRGSVGDRQSGLTEGAEGCHLS